MNSLDLIYFLFRYRLYATFAYILYATFAYILYATFAYITHTYIVQGFIGQKEIFLSCVSAICLSVHLFASVYIIFSRFLFSTDLLLFRFLFFTISRGFFCFCLFFIAFLSVESKISLYIAINTKQRKTFDERSNFLH